MHEYLTIAMMMLEMAAVKSPGEPPLADDIDLIWAAHSYIQAVANSSEASDDAKALFAHIKASVAIEDARRGSNAP